jgi:hypothetical protein
MTPREFCGTSENLLSRVKTKVGDYPSPTSIFMGDLKVDFDKTKQLTTKEHL